MEIAVKTTTPSNRIVARNITSAVSTVLGGLDEREISSRTKATKRRKSSLFFAKTYFTEMPPPNADLVLCHPKGVPVLNLLIKEESIVAVLYICLHGLASVLSESRALRRMLEAVALFGLRIRPDKRRSVPPVGLSRRICPKIEQARSSH